MKKLEKGDKNRYMHILLLFILLIVPYIKVHAQESLESYLESAANNNPEIKATFNQYLAALERVPQVGSLPDPQASLGYFIKPMQLVGGNQMADIQIMQMFPWFGTLKEGKEEASLMAKAKYEEFNTAKAKLFYQVKSSWYLLMKYDREIALVDENIDMLKSLENIALVKFQSPVSDGTSQDMQRPGSMSSAVMNNNQPGLQDILRVKMETLEQNNKKASLLDQRRTEEAVFNALLNRDLETHIQISDSLVKQPLTANRQTIADSILTNNSMMAMLYKETNSYLSMERKAKKMGLPMLGLGINYMLIQERSGNTSMMNGKDMIMPMVSLSLPVYRGKRDAMQKEARLMYEAGNQKIIDLKNNLMVQNYQLLQSIDDAERRIALYNEQENLARRTTELLIAGFTTGENSYEEVLRMQLKVLEYGFKYTEAITDYNRSVAKAEMLLNSIKF